MTETDDTTTTRRGLPEGWTGSKVAGAFALALTLAFLIAGASLIGASDSAFEDAGARIQSLYEAGDVEGMMDAFVEGSIPPEQEEPTANALSQILRPGIGVASVDEPVDVQGVPIVRVTTDDRIEWCVRPDGGVLPRCRIGEIAIETSTDAPAETVLARADIPFEGPTQITLAIESTVPEPVPLRGLELLQEDGEPFPAELVQAVNVVGAQPSEVDPANPTLAAGSTLYLVWTTTEDLSGRDLGLAWEDGQMELDLDRVRWFVG